MAAETRSSGASLAACSSTSAIRSSRVSMCVNLPLTLTAVNQKLTTTLRPAMGEALDELIDLLDLEKIEENIFRGQQPDEDRQRVFGGQVAGQALVAAVRTVEPERHVHSLHAYFLRPGDPSVPILYDVDRIRDGRSFTTRRVVGIQHGKAIFNLAASFQVEEHDQLDHQMAMDEVMFDGRLPPPPETLPDWQERMA